VRGIVDTQAKMSESQLNTTEGAATGPERRDFIVIMATAMAAGGAAAVAWPLIAQMNPSADVVASGSPIAVDLSKIAPGQMITVMWQSKPMFIVNRTPAMLQRLTQPSLLESLRDPNSNEMQQPSYARNWSRSIKPEYLVLVGVCTHLGCIPGFEPAPGAVGPAWPGGWLCPCHGSRYDLAGRVFDGSPAPLNLPVPPHSFASDTSIEIGNNPPGQSFSMSQIQTM
jgi:ubiquinol-cytochrome c reductase iron-sulfur subunit